MVYDVRWGFYFNSIFAITMLFFIFVDRAEGVLNAKAVTGYFPFVTFRRDHERLLELFRRIPLKAKHSRHHHQQCLLIQCGLIVDRLRVQCGDGVLRRWQFEKILLNVVFASGSIAIPNGDAIVQIES